MQCGMTRIRNTLTRVTVDGRGEVEEELLQMQDRERCGRGCCGQNVKTRAPAHDPIAVGFTQLWTLALISSGARPLPRPIAPLNRLPDVAEFHLPRESRQVTTAYGYVGMRLNVSTSLLHRQRGGPACGNVNAEGLLCCLIDVRLLVCLNRFTAHLRILADFNGLSIKKFVYC